MKLSDMQQFSHLLTQDDTQNRHDQIHAVLKSIGYDPENFYQELEMSSHYVDTHRDTSYKNDQVQLHSHAFFELLYCRNSCDAEYLVGSERYRIQRGDIIFVPPGVSHRPLLPENMAEPYRRYVLWLSTDFLEQYAKMFPNRIYKDTAYIGMIRTLGTKWESIGALFRSGVEEAERQQPGWEAIVVGNTMVLLTQLSRAVSEKSAKAMKAEKPELLDAVIAHVEEHLSDRISLDDVAKRFWVSQSTISQTFRKKMGVSFYHFVNQRRLISAKTLIQQGIPLEQVGSQVGFTDYSTFYRAFKKEYGISPRQYRQHQT